MLNSREIRNIRNHEEVARDLRINAGLARTIVWHASPLSISLRVCMCVS